MTSGDDVRIALLRGINVGGHKKVPMAELRALVAGLEYGDVESYVQSGNLVFTSSASPAKIEAALEEAIADHFGFAVDVVVRTGAAWRAYAAGSPFADAEAERPNLLHLALAKRPIAAGVEDGLSAYAKAGERIAVSDGGLWIDFVGGAGRSKLTPAVLDRVVGAPVTARNFRTVRKLAQMAEAARGG